MGDAPLDWDPALPLSGLRIGLIQRDLDGLKDEEKAVYDQALEDLRKAGVKMEPVELPETGANVIRLLLTAEAAAAFDDLTRSGGVRQLRGQAPGDWPNTFRAARLIPAVEYIRAQRARTILMRKMEDLMSRWDVLVGRTGPSLTTTNLSGHPQVVVPCGFVKGMPQGLLFTGRLYEEGALLRVALAYEQATKWHTKRPPLVEA